MFRAVARTQQLLCANIEEFFMCKSPNMAAGWVAFKSSTQCYATPKYCTYVPQMPKPRPAWFCVNLADCSGAEFYTVLYLYGASKSNIH